MSQLFTILATILFTIWITHLWIEARERWLRGRGLIHSAQQVRSETQQMLWKAEHNRAQGIREVWRALTLFVLVLLICIFIGLALIVIGGL